MRVVVVGAGVAGLTAARALVDRGHDVVVVDKGRSPGGRLATRRIDTPDGRVARFDHGAQFFTVRTEAMQQRVDAWMAEGLVREWSRGFARGSNDIIDISATTSSDDGFPRYVVSGGMTALAKHLAVGLDVRCNTLVSSIVPVTDQAWSVTIDGADSLPADAVIVTCPLPQTCALLANSGVDVPAEIRNTEYDRTIALLAVLDGPSGVPAPGGVQQTDGVFSWIGDNVAKGVSDVPAITFHASPSWSDDHWDDALDAQETALRAAATPWLGDATITVAEVKRWRYATPRTVWPEACWSAPDARGPLVLAGDAFAGPRVEGAVLSGIAAAHALLDA